VSSCSLWGRFKMFEKNLLILLSYSNKFLCLEDECLHSTRVLDFPNIDRRNIIIIIIIIGKYTISFMQGIYRYIYS
jgi:hypothetical protein